MGFREKSWLMWRGKHWMSFYASVYWQVVEVFYCLNYWPKGFTSFVMALRHKIFQFDKLWFCSLQSIFKYWTTRGLIHVAIFSFQCCRYWYWNIFKFNCACFWENHGKGTFLFTLLVALQFKQQDSCKGFSFENDTLVVSFEILKWYFENKHHTKLLHTGRAMLFTLMALQPPYTMTDWRHS